MHLRKSVHGDDHLDPINLAAWHTSVNNGPSQITSRFSCRQRGSWDGFDTTQCPGRPLQIRIAPHNQDWIAPHSLLLATPAADGWHKTRIRRSLDAVASHTSSVQVNNAKEHLLVLFRRNRRRRVNNSPLTAVEFCEPRLLLSDDEKFEAVLTSTGATTIGQVEYESDWKDARHKFEVQLRNAAWGLWEIQIDGKPICKFVTDNFGRSIFELDHVEHQHGGSGTVNLPAIKAGMLFSVNFAGNPVNPSIKRIPFSGKLTAENEDDRISAELAASAATTKREIPETEYEADQEGSRQRRRLELAVYNLQPNTSYALNIAGSGGGTITTNALGQAVVKYSDKPRAGYTGFPTGFPAVVSGTAVSVGSVLSSIFATQTGTRTPLSDAGVHLKIAISSATAASGFASWEVYTPDGSLYQWDGKAGANGPRVAVLDDAFFVKPELLTSAAATRDSTVSDDLVKASAARLDRSLELSTASASHNN